MRWSSSPSCSAAARRLKVSSSPPIGPSPGKPERRRNRPIGPLRLTPQLTKLKHGPERRVHLDRRPVRPRDQSLQVDLVDVLGLPPLWTQKPRVPSLWPQLADDALRVQVRGAAAPDLNEPSDLGQKQSRTYHQARRDLPPAPPRKKLITKRSAAMMATMKSQ